MYKGFYRICTRVSMQPGRLDTLYKFDQRSSDRGPNHARGARQGITYANLAFFLRVSIALIGEAPELSR